METRTDIIRELCKANGITIAALERKLGMGNGTIGKYGGFNMRSDRLKAIADYFGVSMEYLMTGEEKIISGKVSYDITDFEYMIISLFRSAPEYKKQAILDLLGVEMETSEKGGAAV